MPNNRTTNSLIEQLCNADQRMTDEQLNALADLLTIDALPALRQVETMDGIAEGIKRMMDDEDFARWSDMRSKS